jgi:ketosteroid isomerase-like protein
MPTAPIHAITVPTIQATIGMSAGIEYGERSVRRTGGERPSKEGVMGAQENIAAAKKGYAAFAAGDAAAAMADMVDDIEWITPGNSAISGITHGKQELGENWTKLAEKGFTTSPQHWFADAERVVVLTQISVAGETADTADVLTYTADAKLIKFQSAGDTALFERVFGSK